jgi:hypothetical protein
VVEIVALWNQIQASMITFFWPLILWWITIAVALGTFVIVLVSVLVSFQEIIRSSRV